VTAHRVQRSARRPPRLRRLCHCERDPQQRRPRRRGVRSRGACVRACPRAAAAALAGAPLCPPHPCTGVLQPGPLPLHALPAHAGGLHQGARARRLGRPLDVSLSIPLADLAYWDPKGAGTGMVLEAGDYTFLVCAHSGDCPAAHAHVVSIPTTVENL